MPDSTEPETQEKTQGSRVIDGPRGGKIRTGGNPGNKGGGVPKSAIREASRESYRRGLETFARIQDILEAKVRECETIEQLEAVKSWATEFLRGMDMAGKYGLGEAKLQNEEVANVLGTVLAELEVTALEDGRLSMRDIEWVTSEMSRRLA